MNLADMAQNRTVKALLIGYPGSAKTGSLASLANAGYNIRILDFDRNIDPLFEYVNKDCMKNVSVIQFADKLVSKKFSSRKGFIEKIVPNGPPTAFARALKAMNEWPEDDLGGVDTWGPNDVLVLDSLTTMGEAAMRRVLHMNNRLAKGPRQSDWGIAQSEQANMLEILKTYNCHILVTAHLKMIGPKFIDDLTDDDTVEDLAEAVKQAMETATGLIPTKLFPSALGRALPQEIGKLFPFIIRYVSRTRGNKVERVISLTPSEDCDTKIPLTGLPKDLGVEDGLLKIFQMVEK